MLCLSTVLAGSAFAEEPYIPPPLQAWVKWVREKDPTAACTLREDQRVCFWPASLLLDLTEHGGKFVFQGELDRDELIPLPGGNGVWPLELAADYPSTAVTVIEKEGKPYAPLKSGSWKVHGVFRWEVRPSVLLVPPNAGLVTLILDGEAIDNPRVSGNGELPLRDQIAGEQAEEDSIEISVERKLEDGLPFKIYTMLQLRIAGKAREIRLGQVVPDGAIIVNIDSTLQNRLEAGNQLVLQGKPGKTAVLLEAVYPAPPEVLRAPKNGGEGWPGRETWAWAPDESLRSVELSGAPGIDPQRTELPPEWRALSAYTVTPENHLRFEQVRRGEEQLPQDVLNLTRTFWLDLNGGGYTIKDELSGNVYSNWRLNFSGELGQVSVDGVPQLITIDPATRKLGVELSKQALSLTAWSRLEEATTVLPATGWAVDVAHLSTTVAFPPGWDLLWAEGPRAACGRLADWTPLRALAVVIGAAAAFKLFGTAAAVFLVLFFILLAPGNDALFLLWFNALAAAGVLRVAKEGAFKKVLYSYLSFSALALTLAAGIFMLLQIEAAFYPQLQPRETLFSLPVWLAVLYRSLTILVPVALAAAFVRLLVKRRWLAAAGIAALFVFCLLFGLASLKQTTYFAGSETGFAPVDADRYAAEESSLPLAAVESPAPREQKAEKKKLLLRAPTALREVDPNAVAQTGPGPAAWDWKSFRLDWDGPVSKESTVRLYLLGPREQLLLSLIHALVLIPALFPFWTWIREILFKTRFILLLIVLLLARSQPCFAQEADGASSFPDQALLQELEERIARNECRERCTTVNDLRLTVEGRRFTLQQSVSSAGLGAASLPGAPGQLVFEDITLNGKPAPALRRESNGIVWVRVPPGQHRIGAAGRLGHGAAIHIQFGLLPLQTQVAAPDWITEGISPTGSTGSSIQLTRKETSVAKEGGIESEVLPVWYNAEREISLGLSRTVRTTVKAIGGGERAHLARIPLLPGEALNTPGIKTENNQALLNFPVGQREIVWESILPETEVLTLQAASGGNITDEWLVHCTTLYQCRVSGAAPVSSVFGGLHKIFWRPWPGEKVELSLLKPRGAGGQVVTTDSAELHTSAEETYLETSLSLAVRTSQAGFKKIQLPPQAEVTEIVVNRRTAPVNAKDGELNLPLIAGANSLSVNWREPRELGFRLLTPAVSVAGGTANAHLSLALPSDRWLLFASGPSWGPVVRYWGKLAVILLAAVVLGLRNVAGLGLLSWVLLGLGLSMLHPLEIALPPLWLAAAAYLGRKVYPTKRAALPGRITVCILSAAAVIVLGRAVFNGLLGAPDMIVDGARRGGLSWYAGRTGSLLPAAEVLSLPLWVWHALMFAWSCWLLFVVGGWLKTAWLAAVTRQEC